MKKTMRDMFDLTTADEIENLVSQNKAPEIAEQDLSNIKSRVYTKTGLKQPQKKKGLWLGWQTAAAVACLFVAAGVMLLFGSGILNFDSVSDLSIDETQENGGVNQNEDNQQNNDTHVNIPGDKPGDTDENTNDGGSDDDIVQSKVISEQGELVMTIVKTRPSCPAFEENCFYAKDDSGRVCRVIWSEFEGLSEEDRIVVQYRDLKKLTYKEYYSGWTPPYELTAVNVVEIGDSDTQNAPYLNMTSDRLLVSLRKSYNISNYYSGGSFDEITYYSMDPSIVQVSESGKIEGVALGETSIIITVKNAYGSAQYQLPVKVFDEYDVPVIIATQDYIELIVGDSFNIMEYIEVSNYTNIYFDSPYPEAVSVDEAGNVTAHREAPVCIRVIAEKDGLVSEVEICVSSLAIPNVLLFEEYARLEIGQTYKLGEVMIATARNVYYESVDPSVATVNDEGVITGVSAGSATIQIYIEVEGQRILANTFSVCVKTPLTPDNSIEEEIVDARRNLTQFETFQWYNENITYLPEYNMNNEQMAECVKFIDGRAKTEASGNITLDNIASVAKTGVDIISLGALTHSVKAFDISMKMR